MKRLECASLLSAALVLSACSGGGGGGDDLVGQGICPSLGNITPTEVNGMCEFQGTITQNATLTSDVTWLLNGPTQVGDGAAVGGVTSSAILTIEPGTDIIATSTSAYLLSYPGSAIQANGTAANPVRFLSEDEGVGGSGEWGGLFLRGFNGLPTLTGTQGANTPFNAASGGVNFTGELVERGNNFTAGWYVDNLRGVGNGLVADPTNLNGFLDGDTNQSCIVDAADTNSPFIITDDGPGGFNQDVAADTFGYDMTHVGSVRGGAVSNVQFDNWTVGTLRSDSFTVRVTP